MGMIEEEDMVGEDGILERTDEEGRWLDGRNGWGREPRSEE